MILSYFLRVTIFVTLFFIIKNKKGYEKLRQALNSECYIPLKSYYGIEIFNENRLLTVLRVYGDELPVEVKNRLDKELEGICKNGNESIFFTVSNLINESGLKQSEYTFRGCSGNSFVAYLLGITGSVNPLQPHYRCKEAHYTEFPETTLKLGCELSDKRCPVCGKKLIKDGFSLSEYFFTGYDHTKRPDFSLNIVSHKKEEVLRLLGYMKGVGQIVGCGKGDGVLRHPGGVMLIPDYAGDAKNYMDLLYGRNGEMVSVENYYDGLDQLFLKIEILTSSQTDHLARVGRSVRDTGRKHYA